MNKKPPFVSVVVPTLNAGETIWACLKSLVDLDYSLFEIIIVDGGSNDGTCEIISKYPVRLVSGRKLGAYAARNLGSEVARGDVIAFTDSDCIVDRQWLKNLAKHYADEMVGGVGGKVLSCSADTIVGRFLSLGEQEVLHASRCFRLPNRESAFMTLGFGSGNMSFRKTALTDIKGFAEDMIKCGDYEACSRVQRAGYQLVYDPEAVTYHKPRRNLSQLMVQMFEFGLSQPKFLTKQNDGYSYFQLRSYIFRSRQVRLKLPIQMLVTVDFFNLAALCLVLAIFYPTLIYLFIGLFLMIGGYALSKWKQALKFKSVGLFLLFPLLHLIRSYCIATGRIVGGLKCRILSV